MLKVNGARPRQCKFETRYVYLRLVETWRNLIALWALKKGSASRRMNIPINIMIYQTEKSLVSREGYKMNSWSPLQLPPDSGLLGWIKNLRRVANCLELFFVVYWRGNGEEELSQKSLAHCELRTLYTFRPSDDYDDANDIHRNRMNEGENHARLIILFQLPQNILSNVAGFAAVPSSYVCTVHEDAIFFHVNSGSKTFTGKIIIIIIVYMCSVRVYYVQRARVLVCDVVQHNRKHTSALTMV